MTQAKDTKPKTPYEESIALLESSVQTGVVVEELHNRRLLREGYLAHGEQGCVSKDCYCFQAGIEEGLEQAAAAR